MSASLSQPSPARLAAVTLVVLLHVALIYAIATGLEHRSVEVARTLIVTTIIDATPPSPPPPPPPKPAVAQPSAAAAPPPAVPAMKPLRAIPIRKPPPKPAARRPITAIPPVKPPIAAEPKPAPPHVPVRVLPRIDEAHSETPEYPTVSRRLGEQGTATLEVLVDASGHAVDTKIVRSSGFPRLDQAAIASIRADYHFVPGTLDGKAQSMWYVFKFTWKLQ